MINEIKVMTQKQKQQAQENLQIVMNNFGEFIIQQVPMIKQVLDPKGYRELDYKWFIDVVYNSKSNEKVFGSYSRELIKHLFEVGAVDKDMWNVAIQIELSK